MNRRVLHDAVLFAKLRTDVGAELLLFGLGELQVLDGIVGFLDGIDGLAGSTATQTGNITAVQLSGGDVKMNRLG